MLHTLQRSRREREQLQLHSTMQPLSHCRDPLPADACCCTSPSLSFLTVPENQVIDVARQGWLHALKRCLGTGRDHSQIAWKLIADGTSCNQLHDCVQLFLQTPLPSISPPPRLPACFLPFIVEQVSSSMRTLLQSTCKFMPTLDLVPAKLLSQQPPPLLLSAPPACPAIEP